uniref:Uncharacterized protein n=1 Tax=Romanomermis culicivorax TaxID=13658 RepID=A0A915IF89_ROMCU
MPPEEAVSQILPIVSELLDYKDQQVRSDACWAVAYLSDATDERITVIINQGIVQKMVRYLNYDEPSLIAPALRCLGNIVTGDDTHTQAVIDSGVLSAIAGAIERGNRNVITKEAMWLLSNIVAGNQKQIQAVLDADLIPIVIKIVKEGDPKSQYEACWVVANLSTGGSLEQVSHVLGKCHDPLFYALSEMLKARESKSLCLALDTMHHLLASSQKADMLEKSLVTVEECGGLDKIESLQSHSNEDIYRKALNLIEQFFNDSEEEAATTSQGQAQTEFSFSPPQDPSAGFKF